MKEQEQNLNHLVRCPVCKTKYSQAQSLILEEKSTRTVFHLTCSRCKTAMLALVSSNQRGVVSLSVATDLNSQEAKSILKDDLVQSENILEVYEKLNEI